MKQNAGKWIVASSAMKRVQQQCSRLAPTEISVVIHGPSGAGKEHVARAIHQMSTRAQAPFVAVNAGAIPRTLAESVFFGHERGAFTGAQQKHRGIFEQADGGTLFLDEVAELSPDLQAKLLRVLDTGTYCSLGGTRTRRVDLRLVAATHRDLRAMVHTGDFREDLYFRVAGARIAVAPLRDRPDDIDALATYFLELFGAHTPPKFTRTARERLRVHHWPGNVRELKSVVRLAVLQAHEGWIDERLVRSAIGDISTHIVAPLEMPIEEALRQSGGNVAAAARRLGLPRTTLRDRLARRYRSAGLVSA